MFTKYHYFKILSDISELEKSQLHVFMSWYVILNKTYIILIAPIKLDLMSESNFNVLSASNEVLLGKEVKVDSDKKVFIKAVANGFLGVSIDDTAEEKEEKDDGERVK